MKKTKEEGIKMWMKRCTFSRIIRLSGIFLNHSSEDGEADDGCGRKDGSAQRRRTMSGLGNILVAGPQRCEVQFLRIASHRIEPPCVMLVRMACVASA